MLESQKFHCLNVADSMIALGIVGAYCSQHDIDRLTQDLSLASPTISAPLEAVKFYLKLVKTNHDQLKAPPRSLVDVIWIASDVAITSDLSFIDRMVLIGIVCAECLPTHSITTGNLPQVARTIVSKKVITAYNLIPQTIARACQYKNN